LRLRTALHYAGRPCCANVLAALEDCWNAWNTSPAVHTVTDACNDREDHWL